MTRPGGSWEGRGEANDEREEGGGESDDGALPQGEQERRLLDEFVALTGYHRWYAVGLLRRHGQARHRGRQPKRVTHAGLALKVRRQRTYDEPVAEELKKIWAIMDYICRKRLGGFCPK